MTKPDRCMGSNCKVPDEPDHSAECVAEHAATVAGGWFVKTPNVSAEALGVLGKRIIELEHGLGYSPEERDYALPHLCAVRDELCAITTDRVTELETALHHCTDALADLREVIEAVEGCEGRLPELDELIESVNALLTSGDNEETESKDD